MNSKEARKIIKDYENLYDLIEGKFSLICETDNHYKYARGIEEIEFHEDKIFIICDNSFSGVCDFVYNEIPFDLVFLDDDTLKETVLRLKKEREEANERKEKEKLVEEEKAKEAKQRAMYEILKSKFG